MRFCPPYLLCGSWAFAISDIARRKGASDGLTQFHLASLDGLEETLDLIREFARRLCGKSGVQDVTVMTQQCPGYLATFLP